MTQKMKFAVVALLPLMAACQTRGVIAPAASVSESSLCQIDREQTFAVAPEADANDPTNKYDTDETVKNLIAHNARLRAACPKE